MASCYAGEVSGDAWKIFISPVPGVQSNSTNTFSVIDLINCNPDGGVDWPSEWLAEMDIVVLAASSRLPVGD